MALAYAEVNHGRWIVRCINCPGAELAINHKTGDLLQVVKCSSCGQVLEVSWPRARQSIGAVLSKRPKRENKNWLPGETLNQLRAENLAHNLEA